MAKAKMVTDYQAIAAERALDSYCLKVLEKQSQNSALSMNAFVSDFSKQVIMDSLGLYNGEEL
jgi:hypothetical protein